MAEPDAPRPRYANAGEAERLLTALGEDFAVMPGPSHAFPPYDIVPLAPKQARLTGWPEAILLDMDGTLTSTEPLCLRALEEVLRLAAGHADDPDWRGLDPQHDYPHLIGNSTTVHVEYIMRKYGDQIVPAALQRHALEAALWLLGNSLEGERLDAVKTNLDQYGLAHLWSDQRLQFFLHDPWKWESPEGQSYHAALLDEYASKVPLHAAGLRTRAGVDIYYRWWHDKLQRIEGGEGRQVARETLGESYSSPITLMPGTGEFLALTRGLLGEEAAKLAPQLSAFLGPLAPDSAKAAQTLKRLGTAFAQSPARLAVVTAAAYYEAFVCLDAAFEAVLDEVTTWPVSEECAMRIHAGFEEKRASIDLLITADDATEARLKPHRDLYTTALQRLGIEPDAYDRVLGIEDSSAGITALRAAGIGLAVAVPFEHSGKQDYSAAAHVVPGGLPAVMLQHGLFLPER